MKTPRVDRAFKVLGKQLREAADLATSVRQDEVPVIRAATPQSIVPESGTLTQAVQLLGRNFRPGAVTVFTPASAGATVRRAPETEVAPANFAFAVFSGEWLSDNTFGYVSLMNEDGTQSDPFGVTLGGY
jgi:hypothetical protein